MVRGLIWSVSRTGPAADVPPSLQVSMCPGTGVLCSLLDEFPHLYGHPAPRLQFVHKDVVKVLSLVLKKLGHLVRLSPPSTTRPLRRVLVVG